MNPIDTLAKPHCSCITDPHAEPAQAALQIIIELVRAGKLSPLQGNADNMIDLYQQFKQHFTQQSSCK